MTDHPKNQVTQGRWVKVTGFMADEAEVFHIVPEMDADVLENKIPVGNPLAQALLGSQVGDTVEYTPPAGRVDLKVVEVGSE